MLSQDIGGVVTYLVVGQEVGDNMTEHLQGYLECSRSGKILGLGGTVLPPQATPGP